MMRKYRSSKHPQHNQEATQFFFARFVRPCMHIGFLQKGPCGPSNRQQVACVRKLPLYRRIDSSMERAK